MCGKELTAENYQKIYIEGKRFALIVCSDQFTCWEKKKTA